MKNMNENKFEMAYNELIKFCRECKLKAHCGLHDMKCDKFYMEHHELYYSFLYPFHPCGQCLVFSACSEKCEPYMHYDNARFVIHADIQKNWVVHFSKDHIPTCMGPLEYGEIDQFNVDYDAELKKKPFFDDLLTTVRQFLEYCKNHNDAEGDVPFYSEFY